MANGSMRYANTYRIQEHMLETYSERMITWDGTDPLPDLPPKRTVEELQAEYIAQRWARLFEWMEKQEGEPLFPDEICPKCGSDIGHYINCPDGCCFVEK